jgi:type II secretory pathway component PulF
MKKTAQKTSKWQMEISIGGVKHNDIMLFTKHLSVALESGFTLNEGLDMLYDQSIGKMKKVVGYLMQVIQAGQPLHIALAKYSRYFSPIYINLVRTGEISGTLDENLKHLARQLSKEHELRQKVKSAMMYPTLVFMAVFGLGFFVGLFILPKILPLFKSLNVELPLSTKILITIAETFQEHGLLLLIATFGFTLFVLWFAKRESIKPFFHSLWLKTPIVRKIMHDVNLQRFTLTLGTLLNSGVPLDTSLDITVKATDNCIYRSAIASFLPGVQRGMTIADEMANFPKLFPKITTRMVAMGERTGNLDSTLKYLSEYYESEIDSTMKNLSTIIEPILLIVIGSVVAFVALSILGPIYKITGSIRG